MNIEKGKSYYGDHVPSGESWLILGVSVDKNSVCVAGYPPTMARLSDITNLEVADDLTEEEITHREKRFGNNWDN